jgi:WD40 repeat protein/transcriptional regulator with XRE-family HTH domain
MTPSIPSSTLEKFITFGDLLRFLRRRVGLTQVEMAIAVGYSNPHICRLEQNQRLPDIPTIEARFVSALGLEEEPRAVARLLELASHVRKEDAPAAGLSPYKGLNYYDESDADLFVGREELTSRLMERVVAMAGHRSSPLTRFLAVVGASGSGKSSIVRAGLVSVLRWNEDSTNWHFHVLTPTAHPLESLASTLIRETNSVIAIATLMDDMARDVRSLQIFARQKLGLEHRSHLLLIVDQFEELFSLCRSEVERSSFIGNLLTASSDVDGPVIVVITLRADFYAHCANYVKLREALAQNQEYIGAMSNEELRRAIEEPARRGRWELEPGLVDVLLHDVGHEPGALPLLSHALFETWQRRRGRMMTLSGYASSGGVRGAIAETAETVFTDQFTLEQQMIARRIFLRLTELSNETAADTRRRATFRELILKPEEDSTTREVLKVLADARLITTTEDSAEVAHEALIREWPTLQVWLEENRDGLRLHRQLTEAAQEWLEMDRSPDILYRGARLAQASEWIAIHQDEMNEMEHEFLTASIEANEREAAEREAQRQRELASAKELAETQRQSASRLHTRHRVITAVGFIAVILAILATIFGLRFRNEKRVAISRELASAAVSNLEVDSELSIMLALQALDTVYTREAEDVLHRALQSSRVRMTLSGHTGGVRSLDISPDGKTIAAASVEGEVTVWETANRQKLFRGPGSIARYSPEGTRLAIGGEDGFVTIWDIATQEVLLTMKGYNENEGSVIPYKRIVDLSFSPNGELLAAANWDGSFKVWDTKTGEERFSSQSSASFQWGYLWGFEKNRLTFSADGKLLVGVDNVDEGSKLRFWSVERDWELVNEQPSNDLMMFSPDGKWLVSRAAPESIDEMGNIVLWDISDITLESLDLSALKPFEINTTIYDVAFSPDSSLLTSRDSDGMINVWQLSSTGPEPFMAFSEPSSGVTEFAFVADGTLLATGDGDGNVKLWDINPEGVQEWFAIEAQGEFVSGLALTADGRYLATAHGNYLDTAGPPGFAKVWELASGKEILAIPSHGASLSDIAISPDGTLLATGDGDTIAKIWQLNFSSEVVTADLLYTWPVGHAPNPASVEFSPDGTKLATGGVPGVIKIWDVGTGQELFSAMGHSSGVRRLAFSPDGQLLAIAGESPDALATVWDVVNGPKISTFPGHENRAYGISDIVVSPDGKRVATVSGDGSAKIWDPRTGEESLVLIGARDVNGVDFSPDGRYLATVSSDGTATKWDAVTGEEIVVYHGPGGPLEYVKITSDGKRIIISGVDYVIGYIFDLDESIRLARSRLTRWFTLEECRKYLHREKCPMPS